MTGTHLADRELGEYVLGGTSDLETRRVERHVRHCLACARKLRAEAMFEMELQSLLGPRRSRLMPTSPSAPSRRDRGNERWLWGTPWSAAAAVIALFVATYPRGYAGPWPRACLGPQASVAHESSELSWCSMADASSRVPTPMARDPRPRVNDEASSQASCGDDALTCS